MEVSVHVGLVRVGRGNLGDRAGQRRLVGLAVADLGPVVEDEGKAGIPLETAVLAGNGEVLADGELRR